MDCTRNRRKMRKKCVLLHFAAPRKKCMESDETIMLKEYSNKFPGFSFIPSGCARATTSQQKWVKIAINARAARCRNQSELKRVRRGMTESEGKPYFNPRWCQGMNFACFAARSERKGRTTRRKNYKINQADCVRWRNICQFSPTEEWTCNRKEPAAFPRFHFMHIK